MTSTVLIQREIALKREARDEGLATPLDIKRGEVTEVSGSIVGDLPYLVWVKPFETNATPMQMFNPGAVQNLQSGMPVFYKRDPEPPGLWTIVGFDSGTWVSDAGTFLSLPGTNTPPHAEKHTMQPGNIGPDPLNVFGHAMVDFAVRPTQPTSMKVRISSGWYPSTTTYAKFNGPENSKDFTADIPASTGKSIIIAISIDKVGVATYTNGVEYVTGEPVPNASLPSVSTDLLLISAVRLDNGMTAIENEHFDHEIRPVFAPGGLARAYIHWKLNDSDDFILPDDKGVFIGLDDVTYDAGSTGDAEFLQVAAEAEAAGFGMYNFTNTNEPRLQFYRATGIDHAAPAAVADTDSLGFMGWKGHGSNQFNAGARIEALVDGTPSGNDVPVGLVLSTHELTDTVDTVVKRLWLTPAGDLGVGIATPDSLGHFHKATAGAVAPPTNTILAVENSGATYMALLSPDASPRGIYFGEPTDNDIGSLIYNPAALADGLEITVNATVGLSVTATTVLIPGDLVHAGDLDNKIAFTDDVQTFTVGGAVLLTLTEAGQDEVAVNGASGDVDFRSESNANTHMLFVNAGTNKLGINSSAPTSIVTIEDETQAAVELKTFDDAFGSVFIGQTAGGDKGTPTATGSGRLAMRFSAGGHDGTNFTNAQAAIDIRTSEVFTPSAQGMNIRWSTTPIGSTTNTERMRLEDSGELGIGTTAPDARLEVQTTATESKQAMTIDQNDADEAFIDFQGSSGAGTSFNLNTTERNTFNTMIMIEVNGTQRWLKAYS